MGRFLVVLMLTNAVCLPVTFAFAGQTQPAAAAQAPPEKKSASTPIVAMPPRPAGKSTVIGGSIQNIDHVRDQFTLKVFGGKSMKISSMSAPDFSRRQAGPAARPAHRRPRVG